jgi:putative endonuclease
MSSVETLLTPDTNCYLILPFLIVLFTMKVHHNYFVYIVICADGFYYTGVTNDIDRRLDEHNSGVNKDCFTYSRRPVTPKYCEHFRNVNDAIAREKQLKGWSRKKKEALFVNDWETIKRLAKSNQ